MSTKKRVFRTASVGHIDHEAIRRAAATTPVAPADPSALAQSIEAARNAGPQASNGKGRPDHWPQPSATRPGASTSDSIIPPVDPETLAQSIRERNRERAKER
jgi:hypothetical protein